MKKSGTTGTGSSTLGTKTEDFNFNKRVEDSFGGHHGWGDETALELSARTYLDIVSIPGAALIGLFTGSGVTCLSFHFRPDPDCFH